NMAVQPSTLKNRLQTMKNSTPKHPSLRWNIAIILVFALMVTGLMACSDVADNGIAKADIQKSQAKIGKSLTIRQEDHSNVTFKGKNMPLFIINGEKMNSTNERD